MSYSIRPQSAQFLMGISDVNQFEDWLAKNQDAIGVSFVGRSNVGKSSIINTLRSKKVCKVAPIPGETKVNYFKIILLWKLYH